MKNNMHVPKETVKHDKKRDEWVDFYDINFDCEGSCDKEGNKRDANSDENNSADEDDKIKLKKKKKDKAQCPFEMIENVAQNMKKVENAVTEHYLDLDKSEKLSERQKKG